MATSDLKAMENVTSSFGGPATFLSPDRPLSVDLVRSIANNVHHGYDQSTQFRVNWTAVGATPQRIEVSPAAADTYELMHAFGPFPWAIRYDGTYMRPVYRLGGSTDNASYSVTFKLCLMQDAQPFAHELALDSVELSTASTTDAYLVPTDNYLSPNENTDPPNNALIGYKTLLEPGGDATEADICQLRLDVWMKATNASATARLFGVNLREYIGT